MPGVKRKLEEATYNKEHPLRVFVNGCWDLPHSGHYNALRQARDIAIEMTGSEDHVFLVAGIHSNSEIRRVKGGAFVISEDEKETILLACKYVDAVAHDVPYKHIDSAVLDRADVRCHFVCHGDDPVVLPDGSDMYGPAKEADRYREFRRTEGISTTMLISRVLWAVSTIETPTSSLSTGASLKSAAFDQLQIGGNPGGFQFAAITSQRLASFSNYPKVNLAHAKNVVYIDGDWDLLHSGHVEILEKAKSLGDFVFAGVHSSMDVSTYSFVNGRKRPIMSTGERALSLLSCGYVQDVILEAPLRPTKDFFSALNIKVVVRVCNHDDFVSDCKDTPLEGRWHAAEELGLVHDLKVESTGSVLATQSLLDRVAAGRADFEQRNEKKKEPAQETIIEARKGQGREALSLIFTA